VPFSAWLYRIAINEINQFFRKQKSHPRTVSVADYQLENLYPEFSEVTADVEKSSFIPILLEYLSPQELQVIELRFFEQKSFKEIGFLLNLTEVNAKVKSYRIVKKLQKQARKLNISWDE
jgi:RNA polymerase sigma-70 factor (ECF subfamily)